MWLKRKPLFSLFILLFLCSACQPTQVEPALSNTPQIIKIGLPPTLEYLKEPIAMCANQDTTYDVLLLEKNSYDWMKEPVDVIFTLQNAIDGADNTYFIDKIDIVIIVSPDMPSLLLNTNQLQAIFNTEMVSPAQIGFAEDNLITIYGFDTSSDMAALFEDQYGFSPQLPVDAFLAASPQLVVDKIANGSTSIGYTLSTVVTNQVKVPTISTDKEADPIPVIASFKSTLSDPQESLIRCLRFLAQGGLSP